MRKAATMRASEVQRLIDCPGSRAACEGLPDKSGDDAERGTRIHALIADLIGDGKIAGDPQEIVTAGEMLGAARDYMDAHHGGIRITIAVEYDLDRKWLTGHPDWVVECNDGTRHVWDWKTGWGEVPEAEVNGQLRAYFVLTQMECATPEITWCHILTPKGRTSVAYGPESLGDATQELTRVDAESLAVDAPRRPSEGACKYCRAFATSRCPETMELPQKTEAAIIKAAEMLPDMPAEKLSALGRAVKLVSSKADMILDEIRRRVEADPESVPGWELKQGKKRRTVTEPARVIKAVAERTGASVGSVINSLAKVSVTAIGDVLKDEGLTKKEASEFWDDELAVWIEEARDRDSLVFKQ